MTTPEPIQSRTSREAFNAAFIALFGRPIDWDARIPWSAADAVEGDWPGWARVGSDRVADRWTGEAPW